MRWKLVSWNINGLRAITRKNLFWPFVESEKPDVICLQEVKIDDAKRAQENFDFPNYREYFNSAKRPGYSGTAVLVRDKLEIPRLNLGIGDKRFDQEGRVQTFEFDKFYLVNAYFPNSREDLSRIDFKIDFNNLLLKHIKKLDKKKPVIITGDYNVAHNPIDLARPKQNEGEHGYHPRERDWMTKLLDSGFVDTFRDKHPDVIKYSWWSQMFGARKRNVGWRIDYFVVSKRMATKIKKAEIQDQVTGSDHCPVTLEIEI